MSRSVNIPGRNTDIGAQLQRLLDPIAGQGFPIAGWTVAEINRNFITSKNFMATVKIFTSIPDEAVRSEMAHQGIIHNFFTATASCTALQFYDFCSWMKSADGLRALTAVQRREKLRRRAQPGQTVAQVALISAFSAQQSEFARARKDVEMAELEFQFAPVAEYEGLEKDVVNERCYEAYRKDCIAQGRGVAEPNHQILTAVVAEYGDQVRNAHILEFLAQGNRTNQLEMWMEDKVLNLEKVGEKRKASTLGSLLDSCGGGVAEEVRAQAQEISAKRRRNDGGSPKKKKKKPASRQPPK